MVTYGIIQAYCPGACEGFPARVIWSRDGRPATWAKKITVGGTPREMGYLSSVVNLYRAARECGRNRESILV